MTHPIQVSTGYVGTGKKREKLKTGERKTQQEHGQVHYVMAISEKGIYLPEDLSKITYEILEEISFPYTKKIPFSLFLTQGSNEENYFLVVPGLREVSAENIEQIREKFGKICLEFYKLEKVGKGENE